MADELAALKAMAQADLMCRGELKPIEQEKPRTNKRPAVQA